jgi:hypothetical protein
MLTLYWPFFFTDGAWRLAEERTVVKLQEERGSIKGPKSQAPTSIEAPNFNLQSSKLAMRLIEIWILKFLWSLDVGIWSFDLWPRPWRMLRA